MDRHTDDNATTAAPEWIEATLRAVRRIDTIQRPVYPAVLCTLRRLLIAIEADEMPVPDVSHLGQGGVEIDWLHGSRTLTFAIEAGLPIRQIKGRAGRPLLTSTAVKYGRHNSIEWARRGVAWIFGERYGQHEKDEL